MQDTWGAQIEGEEALSEFSWQTSQNNGLLPFIIEKSCSTFSAIHACLVFVVARKIMFCFSPCKWKCSCWSCMWRSCYFLPGPLGLKGKKIRHCTKFVNIYVPWFACVKHILVIASGTTKYSLKYSQGFLSFGRSSVSEQNQSTYIHLCFSVYFLEKGGR